MSVLKESKPLAQVASLDLLFGGGDDSAEQIVMLPINKLVPYEGQPYRPYEPDKLQEFADNISLHGVLEPIIVRPYDGKYQILAGHNRTNAAKLAGLQEIPAFVKENCSDIEAMSVMTSTNVHQRDEILPSEKAFAYKMYIEANEKLGAHNVRTTAKLAEMTTESKRNIQYLVRLTLLIKPLLDMVDAKQLPLRTGVNLSYLTHENQKILFTFMQDNSIVSISLNQSESIKNIQELSEIVLKEVFNLVPKQQTAHGKLGKHSKKILKKHFDDSSYSDEEIADILDDLLHQFFSGEIN